MALITHRNWIGRDPHQISFKGDV